MRMTARDAGDKWQVEGPVRRGKDIEDLEGVMWRWLEGGTESGEEFVEAKRSI